MALGWDCPADECTPKAGDPYQRPENKHNERTACAFVGGVSSRGDKKPVAGVVAVRWVLCGLAGCGVSGVVGLLLLGGKVG